MRFLFLLLFPVLVFSGRVSQWSGNFNLAELNYTKIEGDGLVDETTFDLKAQPNPFNPSTMLFVNGIVSGKQSNLRIFNISGKLISELTPALHSGASAITWKADDLPSGVYIARLQSGKRVINLKLVLMR